MKRRDESVQRDDSGSALILALAMITVIGLMLTAVLSFTDTSLVATPVFVTHRNTFNDVDGAMDAVVNNIRGNQFTGAVGFPCGPYTPTEDTSITVDCTPQPGSGSASPDEQPQFAILTTGSSPDGFIQSGNTLLTVDGGLYSNGVVKMNPAGSGSDNSVQTYGNLYAEGACVLQGVNSITSVGGTVKCSTGNDPLGDTPAYTPGRPKAAAFGASIDPYNDCASTNSLVRFYPGIYTEVPRVRVAPSSPACNGKVWWFTPGTYYFDFPDAAFEWKVTKLVTEDIIGGTLANGLNDSSTLADVNAVRAAKNATCDPNAAGGVQFILGGPSAMTVDQDGYLEICSSVSATNYLNHKIAFYGLTPAVVAASGDTVTQQTTTLVETDTPASTGLTAYTPQANAKTIDSPLATAPTPFVPGTAGWATASLSTATPPVRDTSSATLGVFGDVPVGSQIVSATLRVRHYATDLAGAAVGNITPSISVTRGSLSGGLTKFSKADCASAATKFCTDELPFTTSTTFGYDDINNLSVTYSSKVTGNNPAVYDNLDGVQLVVKYVAPAFEATRCPTGVPTCALLMSTVSLNLFFRGTVYAPTDELDLNVHNKDTSIFGRGVIARSLLVDVSSSSKQTDSPFQLPKTTTARKVLLVGKVNGVPKIRALVTFQDYAPLASGTTAVFPGYQVTIDKWSVLR
jgi:hypothetical protein